MALIPQNLYERRIAASDNGHSACNPQKLASVFLPEAFRKGCVPVEKLKPLFRRNDRVAVASRKAQDVFRRRHKRRLVSRDRVDLHQEIFCLDINPCLIRLHMEGAF